MNLPDPNVSLRERLVKSCLDMVVLGLLECSSNIGAYDLIGLIHARFEIMVSPGVIYPVLFSLEREGSVRTRWEERKKVYELTEKGKQMIAALHERYRDAHRRISDVLAEATGGRRINEEVRANE